MVSIKSLIKRMRRGDAGAADAREEGNALKEQQTENEARVGLIKREFADHPSKGLTPAKLYSILEAAERGDLKAQHELFTDMEEKDPQIASDLAKRCQLAAELEWQIVPPDNASAAEKSATDFCAEVFAGIEVEDLIIDLGSAIGHGWVNLELSWSIDGARRRIEQPTFRPHAWFRLHPEEQDRLMLRDLSTHGAELWPLGWVQHRHRAKAGYIARAGLHRVLAWPYLFQNYALGDLAELLEIYGLPARIGTYPSGATPDEKATLLRAVTQLGHRAAGIIPEGMKIDFQEAADGKGDLFQTMLDWCERSKAKAILGGTLTSGTGEGTNTNALGNVHERGQQSLIRSDARQYAGTIGRDILWPLAALNFGIEDRRRAPRFFLDVGDAADLKLLADALPPLVNMGARVPLWWLHEKTRIPQATGKDEILRPTPTTPAPAAPLKTAVAALKGVPPEQEALDAALESLDADTLNAQIREWVEPVLARLESDEDPDALLDYLSAEFPDADGGALEDTLARLIFAGRMWGRLNTDG